MKLHVNGQEHEVDGDRMLIHALRDVIGTLSVKVGCDDSTCGTCVVHANGRLVKACNRPAKQFEGQKITTVEGLTDREKEVYVHAFGETGAVQCGFCTPGMVMAAKVLLDKNPDPTLADVKKAVRTDICRCTGYRQVFDAILQSAQMLREDLPVVEDERRWRLSDRAHRPDVADKVLGTGRFADDVRLPGMVHAKALRSPSPRGLLRGLDTAAALAHPHCLAVLTSDDVPENKIGHITSDWDVLIPVGSHTRYIGDALALVASDDPDLLDEIIALIDVDYVELPPVTSPQEALRPDAPLIHSGGNILDIEHTKRGNPDRALRESAYTVTHKFATPWQDHAFMEPECAVATPDGDGIRMYTSSQSVYDEQHEISRMLQLPVEKVRSSATYVGGGFGGKEDMSVQHHAALMAWHLQRPVKVRFTRTESLNYHVKRHPMHMEFTVGCDAHGKLTAVKCVILSDTGAYASLGGPVLQRACTHAGGPYAIDNFEVLGMAMYTNNTPSGAFRGFGVVQSQFAMETCVNELAEKVGLDAWEMRYLNVVRPGDCLPNGQIADESTGIAEVLEDLKGDFYADPKAGLAIAHKNTGIGMGLTDTGRCILSVQDGRVHIRTSASCMGQGVGQVTMHVLSETVDLRPDQIVFELPDTARTPDSGTSTGSRQTLFTGEATRLAAVQLRDALIAVDGDLSRLEGQEWLGEFSPETDVVDSTKPNPYSHVAYGYGAQLITLNDKGEVNKVVAVYDVGTVMNEQSAVGQIEGGVMMGLGYGLTEEFVITGGIPQTRYGKLGLIRADKMPQVEVRFVKGPGTLPYAYGAKGMGEICLIPTAPAAAWAYYQRDGKRRYSLPLRGTAYKPEVPDTFGAPQPTYGAPVSTAAGAPTEAC
ncbi:Aldehyde oxidoreductase [Austwickia sp. TVS 96-490-7B]|uniref:selenium-dependent xanthine dehydrogenase n=1 Tax=Austwickia sp. TVS 96-490-7B TaxID=2830843 RepID=UPI001C5A2AC3|nr:selenium-dependent xanthine dehydrogenase [Austwickia sp. TVS 96-490-7B]MBW3087000.1 Aldehyde oxidoreductase [Austwickia sp. TVS 96-490-7B]